MRTLRILGSIIVTTLLGAFVGVVPQASAAALPSFPMALPVQWGATVKASGPHTFASGTQSSVDLGANGNASIPVVAAADGVATVGGANGYSRCYVTVTHSGGWQTKYYHLKGVPSDLRNGDRVVAGEKIGMTAAPGSETCGRGSSRHLHFTLLRNNVEQSIDGLSLGGYTVHNTARGYCGYWTRDSDGAIVADARRLCFTVPGLKNAVVNPATLAGRDNSGGPSRDEDRPPISAQDTIPAAELYTTEGQHSVNGRAWKTSCEPYSRTTRCRTEIWAVVAISDGGKFGMKEGWAFNNLTYLESSRTLWAANPLGFDNDGSGGWTAAEGRKWKTDCDSDATGRNGCRSYTWVTTAVSTAKSSGGYRYSTTTGWVFNNMVRFTS